MTFHSFSESIEAQQVSMAPSRGPHPHEEVGAMNSSRAPGSVVSDLSSFPGKFFISPLAASTGQRYSTVLWRLKGGVFS